VHSARLTPLALIAVVGASALAGCGGSSVDRDGFTAGDRKLAQERLDELHQTSIPGALLEITSTVRRIPEVCRIHVASANAKPKTFRLFLFWAPNDPLDKSATYTWFEATLREASALDTFHIGYAAQQLPKAQVLKAHAGGAFSKPTKKCQVLASGYLRLLT
jgi:hypothetical protein